MAKTLDDLVDKLDKLDDFDLDTVLNKACIIVENAAKQNCPVDTGQLKNSITHEVTDNEGYVGTNVEYAPYVEFGTGLYSVKGDGRKGSWSYQDAEGNWHKTSGMPAHPFLQPALDANKSKIMKLLQDEVKEALKK